MSKKDTSREIAILNIIMRQAHMAWDQINSQDGKTKIILDNLIVNKTEDNYVIETNYNDKVFRAEIPLKNFKLYSVKDIDSENEDPVRLNIKTAKNLIQSIEIFYGLSNKILKTKKKRFNFHIPTDFQALIAICIYIFPNNSHITELKLAALAIFFRISFNMNIRKRKQSILKTFVLLGFFLTILKYSNFYQKDQVLNYLLIFNVLFITLIKTRLKNYLFNILVFTTIGIELIYLNKIQNLPIDQQIYQISFLASTFLASVLISSHNTKTSILYLFILLIVISFISKILLIGIGVNLIVKIIFLIYLEMIFFVHQTRKRSNFIMAGLVIL